MVIAVITNVNLPDCMEKTDIEQVIQAAQKASPRLAELVEAIVQKIDI